MATKIKSVLVKDEYGNQVEIPLKEFFRLCEECTTKSVKPTKDGKTSK